MQHRKGTLAAMTQPGGSSVGKVSRSFIGRDAEFGEITRGVDDAIAGRGRVFLIVGEAGIGKTRLADEVADAAKQRGARVFWGRC